MADLSGTIQRSHFLSGVSVPQRAKRPRRWSLKPGGNLDLSLAGRTTRQSGKVLGSSIITPSKTARNLVVVIDDQLNFSDHITKTAQSCRFALYNIKKIRPFLSEHATTPCSGSCSVQTGLLQCSLGRSSTQFHQTSTINPKRCCKINL